MHVKLNVESFSNHYVPYKYLNFSNLSAVSSTPELPFMGMLGSRIFNTLGLSESKSIYLLDLVLMSKFNFFLLPYFSMQEHNAK